MAKRRNDDLFEGTTMSFGEHLEELRSALFKSMFGLVIGVLLGLLVAGQIVEQIQRPLKRSLETFYADKAITTLETQYGKGGIPPGLKSFIIHNKFKFEIIYIERGLLSRFKAPPPIDGETPSAEAKDDATGSSKSKDGESPAEEAQADSETEGSRTTRTEEGPEEEGKTPDFDLVQWILRRIGYGKRSDAAGREETELTELMNEPLPTPDPHMVKTRIWRPLDVSITSLSAQEVFMIWMKAALIAGCVISSPWVFYQIWNFVAAGLYPHEKNYVYLYLPFSLLLFLAGAALAFFFVFDPVLEFLFQFNKSMGIDPDPRINEWMSFVLYLPLGFGVSFQLPLVMLFLNRIGLFSIQVYLARWRIAILTIFVISMVLTPADPISMLLMALPLTFLYFFGVALCRWMPRGRNPFDEAY